MPMIHVVLRGLSLPCVFFFPCRCLRSMSLIPFRTARTLILATGSASLPPACAHSAPPCKRLRRGRCRQVIALPEGTYNWTLGQLDLEEGDITVNGDGARTTIIDADGHQPLLRAGCSDLVGFNDLELRNGFDNNDPGGAIDCDDLNCSSWRTSCSGTV